jgi:hypothetical protein
VLKLLADESFNGEVVRQIRRKVPHADLVTVPESG